MVAAALRSIFAQPDRAAATQQLREVVKAMASRGPRAAEVVAGAEEDVLAYVPFPIEHWTRIYSTNPLERLNEEGKRPHECGRLLPRRGLGLTPGGNVLLEIWDEGQVGRRYFSQESMTKLSQPEALVVVEPQPLTLAPVK